MSGFEENQEQNAKNMTFKSDGSGTRNDGFEGPLKVWFYTTYNQFFMKIKYYFMKSLKIEIRNILGCCNGITWKILWKCESRIW